MEYFERSIEMRKFRSKAEALAQRFVAQQTCRPDLVQLCKTGPQAFMRISYLLSYHPHVLTSWSVAELGPPGRGSINIARTLKDKRRAISYNNLNSVNLTLFNYI